MRAQITKVVIRRAEGPTELCKTTEFNSLAAAQDFLLAQASTFPTDGCYDKHDVTLTFSDGADIGLRMDCKAPGCPDADLYIGGHLRGYVGFYAGLLRPAGVSEAHYVEHLASYGADHQVEFIAFARNHECGLF